MRYIIRQCSEPTCRFRYPAPMDDDQSWAARAAASPCVACGAPTVIAAIIPQHPQRAEDADHALPPSRHIEALLDNIRSIYNVGSIFRTADGAGVRRLHLCGITPTPDHPKVAKTALGAEQAISWRAYNNAVDAAMALKNKGFTIVALEEGVGVNQKLNFFKKLSFSADQPILLVVGNEIAGIDPGVLALADHGLAIPMRGVKRSLNVATAFGIAVYGLTG